MHPGRQQMKVQVHLKGVTGFRLWSGSTQWLWAFAEYSSRWEISIFYEIFKDAPTMSTSYIRVPVFNCWLHPGSQPSTTAPVRKNHDGLCRQFLALIFFFPSCWFFWKAKRQKEWHTVQDLQSNSTTFQMSMNNWDWDTQNPELATSSASRNTGGGVSNT